MQTKVCSKCKLEKDVCEFYKNSKKIGTYRAKCNFVLLRKVKTILKTIEKNETKYKKIGEKKIKKKLITTEKNITI